MGIVAVGRFDGVHLGHQFLLAEARKLAEEEGLPLIAYTFPSRGEALLPLVAKRALLLRLCDRVIVQDWEAVRGFSPEEFVRGELLGRLRAKGVVLGPNHRFGRDAAGDVGLLVELGKRFGFRVQVVSPLELGGELVSSRRIRRLVREGRVREAGALLGRPPTVFGEPVRGAGLARELGFPTVNLALWPGLVRPRSGVYLAWAHWPGGEAGGLFYLGARPTFPELPPSAELHLLRPPSPQGTFEVALFDFLRPDMRFAGKEELVRQLARDVEKAKAFFEAASPPAPILVNPKEAG
ncbi:MAG: Riboflavin biosynthesis protein RibF [Acetothermia bacterium 64_32]|nr:MAG: Riboflavin biosynthesis protein RibF [Acetothermia bacterium 64_32]MBC7098479.1 adenylyltransferase/cytidyltransferase family protein [Candidatus Bipolaricaulota bacterium]HAF70017.1 hypothetical protein [Candidatus Acetothermia bacterium]